MMRKWVLGLGAVATVTTCAIAQRGERVSAGCRKEIVQLCGITRDRAVIATCLQEKGSTLTENCRGEIRERMAARGRDKARKPKPAIGAVEYSYGSDALQKLDYFKATATNAPLVIFVHGGGWKRGDKGNATGQYKPLHYNGQGYAFASINYRLVPGATVEQQAADIASAVAYLVNNAAKLGFDKSRIVLMGHSAGAHLVALVGTDPQYLKGVGLDLSVLDGVIPLDGAAYDVPQQMVDGNRMMQDTYSEAFGSDPTRQKALSPYYQAASPNAPSFLILHVDRDDGTRQSEALASALKTSGTAVQLNAIEGKGLKGHMEINRQLGDPEYPATPIVDGWLKRVFG